MGGGPGESVAQLYMRSSYRSSSGFGSTDVPATEILFFSNGPWLLQ